MWHVVMRYAVLVCHLRSIFQDVGKNFDAKLSILIWKVFIHENLSSLSLIHVSVRLETRVCLPENLEDLYLVDLFRQFDLI